MNRRGRHQWAIVLTLGVLLLVTLSSCGGSVQATSWTGLVVVDDVVYAADLSQVQALDAETGKTIWAYPVDPKEAGRGQFYVTPAVDDGHVIVASATPPGGFFKSPEHVVWALDRDGRELWSFRGAAGQFVEGGAIGSDLFVVGNSDGNVYALDLENGQLRWKFETEHRVWSTPLIDSDTVYIGSMDRSLYALDMSDGSQIWRFDAEGSVAQGSFAGTPGLKDGTLYVGNFANYFYAIDAASGEEVWNRSFDQGNWFWGSPVVDGEILYVADVDGVVYAFDVTDGSDLWSTALKDDRDKPAPVRAGVALAEGGDLLIVASENGTLYALDTTGEVYPEKGHVDWKTTFEGKLVSDPVVSGTNIFQPVIQGPERIIVTSETGQRVWAHPPVVEE